MARAAQGDVFWFGARHHPKLGPSVIRSALLKVRSMRSGRLKSPIPPANDFCFQSGGAFIFCVVPSFVPVLALEGQQIGPVVVLAKHLQRLTERRLSLVELSQ